jgi:hypothetical protein
MTVTTYGLMQVRKERLGDRITALHQIVSPFGKVRTKKYTQHNMDPLIDYVERQQQLVTSSRLERKIR